MMDTDAWIALGANLGNRAETIAEALALLSGTGGIQDLVAAPVMETEPVGGPPGQPMYLNTVCRVQTSLSPEALLQVCLGIEKRLGRVRAERWGARVIDLDLLAYGDLVRSGPGLTLPHPRMQERVFVLEPLRVLAPEWRHPVLGETPAEMLARRVETSRLRMDPGEPHAGD